jgi:hypothetical protein
MSTNSANKARAGFWAPAIRLPLLNKSSTAGKISAAAPNIPSVLDAKEAGTLASWTILTKSYKSLSKPPALVKKLIMLLLAWAGPSPVTLSIEK